MNQLPYPGLARLEQEERTVCTIAAFSFEDGLRIANIAADKARLENWPIVIDVFAYGQVIAHIALPGSSPDNGDWVRRKRNTVLRCAHSSLYMGQKEREEGFDLLDMFAMDPKEYAIHGGCVPIFLKGGGLIGAITVSGLHEVHDHEFAIDILKSI